MMVIRNGFARTDVDINLSTNQKEKAKQKNQGRMSEGHCRTASCDGHQKVYRIFSTGSQ